jgi:hypothetical protein
MKVPEYQGGRSLEGQKSLSGRPIQAVCYVEVGPAAGAGAGLFPGQGIGREYASNVLAVFLCRDVEQRPSAHEVVPGGAPCAASSSPGLSPFPS